MLLRILNMIDIKGGLLLWFTKFLDKKSASLKDKSVAGRRINMHANNKIKQNHN